LLTLDAASRQLPRAVERVRAFTAKAPDNAQGFYLASRAYAATGDLPQAEAAVRRAIELDPAFLQAYGLLGQLYVRQQKLDAAKAEYERIIQQRPDNLAAHTMVAMLLQVQQKDDEARQAYEKILGLDARAPVAANNLAYMQAERGENLDRALNLAQTAKAALPDDPDVNDTLGWVYYKRDLASLAIPPLEQSVASSPSNPLYRYHLGLAYLKAGNKTKARAALEQALKLQPNFEGAADARKALGGIEG
jgi:tetratricopeptide (TPR) repeat protein